MTFFFRNNSCSNAVSDNLFLQGTKICPAQLNKRSTGAELGVAALVWQKRRATRGYFFRILRSEVNSGD